MSVCPRCNIELVRVEGLAAAGMTGLSEVYCIVLGHKLHLSVFLCPQCHKLEVFALDDKLEEPRRKVRLETTYPVPRLKIPREKRQSRAGFEGLRFFVDEKRRDET